MFRSPHMGIIGHRGGPHHEARVADDGGRSGKVRLKALLILCALLSTLSALPFIARTEASSATDSSLITRHSLQSNHSSLFSRLANDSDSFTKIWSSRRRAGDLLTVAVAGPEIDVKGNGNSIGNTDNTPDTADGTDFGSFPASHTFTIENTGDSDLTLTGVQITGANASDFTVTAQPTSPVVASGSTTFTIFAGASAPGTRTATVSIANDDSDENPYTFDIQIVGLAVLTVTPATSPNATDNDYTRINNAVQAAFNGQTIKLLGTFNWNEANAAASWALGSDGLTGGSFSDDDYGITPKANVNNVTLTADSLGLASIQGPGDLAAVNLEGVFAFFRGQNQNWTISNLRFLDFDLSIGMFQTTTTDFNNTHITNNYIRMARDLNAAVAPADTNQNIGIHFSFGTNQVISGNTIEIQGDGVSDTSVLLNPRFASDVAMQSNTSGGAVYEGLQITNNIVRVLLAQDAANPQVVLGIWENGHAHTSNITVSGNQFVNQAVGNNPATNLQRGFRVTSHSSATTTVTYSGNTVSGANIGFQWYTPANFSGNLPVIVTGNTLTNNRTGVLVQSQGLANLNFNRLVGNTTGVNNVDGIVNAENNWWGCNAGPGDLSCDSVAGSVVFNPWVVLLVSASPTSTFPGGTSTITADMTRNSAGGNPAHGGAAILPLPDASFTATNGDMSAPPHPFTSGLSTATFTSNSTSSGSACAQVDAEQECANITVTAPPTFSIDNVTHNEGNGGPTTYTFTVTKSGTTGLSASVNYATADDSATSPSDFTAATTTTLTFTPLETTKTFDVTVNGDLAKEPTEAFFVNLSSPTNATILDGQGVGTITNDDCLTAPTTVYVDDSWVGTTPGTDPDAGASPAMNFGCDAFATIQEGVNAVASGGTVMVNAGNYPENVLVNKSVILNGPKAGVDPTNGSRLVEADEAIVRPAVTSIEPATSGTVFRVGTNSGHINVTINGFTIDGHNPLLTGGRTLNTVEVHTGAGIITSTGSFDNETSGYDTTMIVTNNIIQNLERYGVYISGVNSGSQVLAGNDVSHNKIDNLPSGNNFIGGIGGRGRGIAFGWDVYGSATFNKLTRVNVGWQDDNHFQASTGLATVVSNNEIHAYHRGIFHNLQYQNASTATISNNNIFAETDGDFPASTTNFGIELSSIESTVNVNVTNNNSTGNVYGILLWNLPTTANITISGGTLTNNTYGVYATNEDSQFGAVSSATTASVSGVTINGATTAGLAVVDSPGAGATGTVALEVSGNTAISSSAVGAIGILVSGANASANIHHNSASIHGNATGIKVDGGSATITGNTLYDNGTGLEFANSPTVTAHFNRIISNTTAIRNPGNATVDLENNWWGCNDGPNENGCGAVTGSNADFDPWVVLLVTASPDSIIPGGTSTATADMTKNSADAAHGGAATLPLPDAMLFATNGTMSDASKPFTAGLLTSTFTSTNGSNGGACAKVDNQPQCASITVTPPSFSIDSVAIAETDAGTTNLIFTVTKNGNTNLSSSVVYTTADNTAKVSDGDYASATNTLTFGPADTTMQLTVQVAGDTRLEPDETFFVDLSSPVNATISQGRGVGTIQNDDSGPTFSINNVTMAEGNGATTNFTFTVTKTGTTGERARVDFATANGTTNPALGGGACGGPEDYVSQTGTVQFTPAETTKTVTVAVCGGVKPELDDTFFVNLSNAVNASISSGQGIGTITNDDTCSAPSTVYVDDNWAGTTIGEDPDSGGPATFFGCDAFDTVQRGLSGIAPLSTGVAPGGTVIVADGTYTENLILNKQVSLQGAQFGVDARGRVGSESIVTPASAARALELRTGSAGSLIDGFTFSGGAFVGTSGLIESTSGPLNNLQISNNRFTSFPGRAVNLNDSGADITVNQNEINGSGNTAGVSGVFHLDTDSFTGFHFTNNTVTGAAFTEGFFVDGNHTVGPSGTRTPLISGNVFNNNSVGANLGKFAFTGAPSTNNGTISNNTFSNNLADGLQGGIQNTTISGNTFSGNGRHGLALTGFSGSVSADSTRGAINTLVLSNTFTGNGFVSTGAGISFNAFQFAGTIATNQAHFNRIVGNATGALYNGSETINLENNWWGCNFGPGGVGSGCNVTPNGLGGTGAASLDGNPWIVLTTSASPNPTTPGGASTVTADMTHNSAPATLTPPPSVPPVGVTFSATNGNLSSASGTITSGQANTTFTSNSTSAGTACSTVDGQEDCTPINIQLPQFSIGNVTQVETNSGTTAFVFDVTKTGATTFASTVQFQTADDSATILDGDYQSASGTLNFGPTDTLKQITVQVNGDNNFEANDAFFVNLFNAVDATISDSQGVGTITNDDFQPTISIDDVTHNEGNVHGVANDPDLTNYTFTVTLSNQSFQTVTVDYATANNSANAPLDYTQLTTTSLTFNPGETSKQLTVVAKGDTTYELNETFFVTLTSPTNATTTDQGIGTLTNDDAAPTLSIGNRTRPEGTTVGATTSYDFTVTKAGSTEVTATVNFATAPGTATGNAAPCPSGDDYQNQTGSLSFLANETTKTITVLVCKDAVFEADETFFVNLTGETHATLADGQGLGTIQNDDSPPPLSPVNTTDDLDDGNCNVTHCSLREAINAANASASASVVFGIPAGDSRHFYYADDGVANHVTNDVTHVLTTIDSNDLNIVGIDPDWPHSWWSIRPASPLPDIAASGVGIFIDGYTQTGASANTSAPGDDAVLRVELDGSGIVAGVTHGLTVGAGANTITGLIINRFISDGNPGTGNGIGVTSSDTIRGNFIGTDASGTLGLGNAGSGIALPSGFGSNIGGSADADVNLISGNNADGIALSNSNTNLVLGNLIGTRANGASGLPNGGTGISLTGGGSAFNTIGGENVGEANTIAFNGGDGVSLTTAGPGNSIRGNSIFSNGTTSLHLGIDLGADGVTANDAPASLDADSGPNNLQNFPVITLAQVTGSTRTITGALNSTAGDTFTIDFYQSTACDSSGNGEGRTYLGSLTTDPTDASGNVSFTFHPLVLTVGQSVTATATSTGAAFNTSEFSACSGVTDGSPGAGDIQFTDATYSVSEGGGTASITVTRVGGSNGSITATFSTSNGTAAAPGDYTAVNNFPITYVEGETGSKTVTVTIVNDPTFETNETVNLSLSHPPQINIVQRDAEAAAPVQVLADPYSAMLTINDNDAAPTFTIDDVTHNEGDAGTTAYTFTVTKTGSTELNATVNYATVDGTATAPSDFTAIGTTTLTFLPADTTKQFTVQVNGDPTVETDDAFAVHLSNAVNATISDADGVGTITNDDTDVSVAVSPASVSEDGATNLVYTFTRSGVTSSALTVNFSVGGNATFGTDYTQTGAATFGATSGTVNFGAGNTTATVTVDPSADTTVEGDETAILTVTSGSGYNIASPSAATGTITNDDTDVSVAVSPAAATEDGSTNLVYTFTRTGNISSALEVNFSVGGDAAFGTDYTQTGATTFGASSGTVTFGAGNSTATVTVDPSTDLTFELNETVILTVTSGTGYNVASPSASTGTISNDDSAPTFAIDDVTHNEGNAGTTAYTFTVTRTGSTALNATVDYATVAGTANAPSDFTAIGTTTLTFLPADTTKQFTVLVNGDTTVETDEAFAVHLSNAINATISDADGAGTIINDDTDVSVAVSPASVSEDGATNLVYTFTRAGVTSGALTVNFSVGGNATFGTDYTQTGAATFGATSGTVNFGAGNTTATVTIDPTADSTVEGNETAILTVTAGAGYNVASPSAATGTITNDDTDVSVAVSPASVSEDGATNLVYTFTRNGVTSGALTVNFSVGGDATFGTDYTQTGAATFGATSGTVNFGAGNTTATVTIDPTADTTVEGNETAILTVTTGAGYNVASPSAATGTITNDDTDVTLAVSPALVSEDGATNLVYTFTRAGVTSGALTVNFSVGGDATFGTDYTQTGAATFGTTSGTVNFGAGNTTATVTIDPTADTTPEANETAILTVTTGAGYNVASPSQATGTITEDDTDVSVAVSPASVSEDGATNLVYTFTRSGVTSGALTVNFSVGGSATFGTDYTQTGAATFGTTSGTVNFGAGNTTATVTIDPTADTTAEGNETAILTVTTGAGYNVASPSQATGTINDDDAAGGIVRFSAANYNTTESSGSTTITVERVGDTSQEVTVDYDGPDDSAGTIVVPCATISGLATPRCDFTTTLGTLRFAAGETSKTFTVLISQDNYVEGPETLTLTLSNLTGGATFGTPSTATLTIADDATEPPASPIDDAQNFVRQHYHDFLNREPDPAGLAFWTNQILACGSNVQCIEETRISVSASFFLSIEFQDTGYLVERLYKVSYGDATGSSTIGPPHTLPVPNVKFSEFMRDTQKISQGLIVLQPGWETVLENNKQAFVAEFVQRPRFATAYPTTLTPAAFVDALFAHAGVTPLTSDRDDAINEFGAAPNTVGLAARGRVLRRVAEIATLRTNESNRAFVLMQYFGYLRRNPDAAQDTDHSGYEFWLTKLNQFNGNFINAEMVKAFISSIEYRQKFSQ